MSHWKRLFNAEYLGVWTFEDLGVKELNVTIKQIIKDAEIVGENGRKDHKPVAVFEEAGVLPLILNRTNCKKIEKETGTGSIENWVGVKLNLKVKKDKCFGTVEDTVRVDHVVKQDDKKIACEMCGNNIQPAYGMTVTQLAQYTKKSYGKQLCAECAKKAKEGANQ